MMMAIKPGTLMERPGSLWGEGRQGGFRRMFFFFFCFNWEAGNGFSVEENCCFLWTGMPWVVMRKASHVF